jgi:uncharacterized membrane protein required for colicin V production
MSIWILAILILAAAALAGWRQGAIRAAIIFVGIIFSALLAVPLGRLFHPLLPHVGAHNPITVWALAPVCGFILASIPFIAAAQYVHHRVEHHYKYKAGELQRALYSRVNTRLGICLGVLNGVAYFVLVSFFVFNIGYWTTQAAADPANLSEQPWTLRLASYLGDSLQAAGFSRTASAVGTLPPIFYRLADFCGLLMQNGQKVGPRLAEYPGLTSLWHRDDMQPLVADPNIRNSLSSGASLSDIFKFDTVQSLIANKDLSKLVMATVTNNLDDITNYVMTGKSAKYDRELILGKWQFNSGVTLAWLRQDQPKLGASEMAAIRALWPQAYGPVTFEFTGDNQVYVKSWPKFEKQPQPNQPPFQPQDWQGDWSRDGINYTIHITFSGEEKYLNGTTDGVRMRIKDGRTLLIFDHTD